MARTIGRAFKISKNDAKSYSYVSAPRKRRRRLKSNAGVTHIASINGRGAYGRRSTPRSTRRLTMNARLRRAKEALTREKRKSFRSKLKSNVARKRKSVTKRRTGMRRNAQTAKQRAAALRNLKKARAARRKKAGTTTRRRKRRTTKAAPKRRVSAKRSAAAKKAARTRKRRARAALTPNRRRKTRRKTTTRRRKVTANRRPRRRVRRNPTRRRTTTRRRKLRRNSWPGDSARHSTASKKGWRKRRRKAGVRKTRKSRPMTKRRRSLAAKRGWRKRKGMTANRRTTRRRKARRNPTRRRRLRRNARMSYVSNRRRRRVTRNRRRGMRRNGRRRMRRNSIGGAFRTAGMIAVGFLGHKLITGLLRDLVFKPAVETVAPEAASPASGLGQLNAYSGVLVGGATALAGILLMGKVIKQPEDRQLVIGGIALSWLHTAIVAVLDKMGAPGMATTLAGIEDGTAAQISAMYGFRGLGAGTSIQPEYAAIRGLRGRGMGEYFKSGFGEYFASGMNGMGEYFASGVNGLGALKPYEAAAGFGYTHNPDMMQAAAGMGVVETTNGNHIDPSSDLDRELTIAEAAAGVGQVYQAAAGFGATPVVTVPRSNTWIPGMSDPAIWAGAKAINESQAQHELLTAGILQTDGGQGVFG